MTERNGETNVRVPDELIDGLNTAMYAGRRIFGVDIPVHYDIILSDSEEDIQFPVKIKHFDNKKAVIKVHTDSMLQEYACGEIYDATSGDQLGELVEGGLTFADACKIHIAASVIPHMLICAVNPRDGRVISQLYEYMSHPDTLTSSIADNLLEIGEFELRLRAEVMKRSSDKIAEINRYRLAFGCIGYLVSDAGIEISADRQKVDFGERIPSIYIDRLTELEGQMAGYVETARWLGMDEHDAENSFLAEISSFELAAAFPMQLPEISLLARIVAGNKK